MSVDFEKTIKVSAMQKLASLASRCSKIDMYMKPYVMVLYREYAARGQHTSFMISSPNGIGILYYIPGAIRDTLIGS